MILKQKLEKIEVPEDESTITEIKLDGRTRMDGEDGKCKCDVVILMSKGCQCGNK